MGILHKSPGVKVGSQLISKISKTAFAKHYCTRPKKLTKQLASLTFELGLGTGILPPNVGSLSHQSLQGSGMLTVHLEPWNHVEPGHVDVQTNEFK